MATLNIEKGRKVTAKAAPKKGAAPRKKKAQRAGSLTVTKEFAPGGIVTVSQSRVKSFRKCRKQHHNKYVLGLRKKVKSRSLMFGSVIHRMIEADANADDPFETLDKVSETNEKLFKSEREAYGELVSDIRVIMTDYFEYWDKHKKAIVYSRRAGRSAEHLFEIDIADGLKFKGKIDAVGKSQKMRWLVEHKSFKRMPSEDDRWKSVQSGAYIRAIQMMGWWTDLEGTLWDYVGNKEPATPKILESGKISEAQLNSLPGRVRAFLKTQKAKEKDYPKLMKQVTENRDNWFLRIYTPLNEQVVQTTWDDFLETALEIQRVGETSKTRSIDQHCNWCDFKALCQAEIAGLDVDFVIQREYTYEPEESIDGEEEPE